MKRLLPLLLALGCTASKDALKVDEDREGLTISLRRDGEWRPVARVTGPHFPSLAGSPPDLAFRAAGEVRVEVFGRRSMALFPGLEFLEGDEVSSSDRDARGPLADRRRPDMAKVTVPLMAYEVDGVLVSLMWKEGARPFFEAREKNLMGLAPVGEEFQAVLHVEPGATIYDAVPAWARAFGLPAPEKWPRTLEEELALCKAGFETVSVKGGKHRHCAGKDWPPAYAPGFGVLLHLLGEKVDWTLNYPDLLDNANCHILRWEAPFHAGEPETVRKVVERLKMLLGWRMEGEWGFHPMDDKQATLGKAGEKVLGTSAYNALAFAKAARMTGNGEMESMALETLRALRKYKVPRGAQTWECPLHEPDLLAAAYAVGGYVEAYKLSRDEGYLKDAVRWAKAGLPFLYLWSLPGRHGMLYGSIPVFGTTHFTHPWFGVPVQWNGLVYAYYLRKLAPLDKSFDWLRVADGITASAVHQQYADGPSKGCYPDGFYDQCTRRAPPDLNPEDILVNVLTSIGKDPDPDLSLKK